MRADALRAEAWAGEPFLRPDDDPDVVLYGARNRLYLSTDGGTLWRGLAPELPEIEAIAFE